MMINVSMNPVLYWVTAFFFLSATVYLTYIIKREHFPVLYPVSTYLGSMTVFFILLGVFKIVGSSYVITVASFTVMFGASSMARFPLKLIIPKKEKLIFTIFLITAVGLSIYTFTTGDNNLQLKVAHTYAFLLAGVFTTGYVAYLGIKTRNRLVKVKSLSSAASLGLCCVVAHGLIAIQFLPFTVLSFFGPFATKSPVFFAMVAPIAFIFVLLIGRIMRNKKKEVKKSG